jgi:hypothetical protein
MLRHEAPRLSYPDSNNVAPARQWYETGNEYFALVVVAEHKRRSAPFGNDPASYELDAVHTIKHMYKHR